MINKRADYVGLVRKFHLVFGHYAPPMVQHTWADEDLYKLRDTLITEETLEVINALSAKKLDLVELADGLCDLIYVAAGGLVSQGQPTGKYVPQFSKMKEEGEDLVFTEILWLVGTGIASKRVLPDKMTYWEAPMNEIIYRAEWIAHNHSIPLKECFEEVQRSNMSKLGADGKPIYFTSGVKKGKTKKGPNFTKPNLAKILKAHGLI